SALGPHPFPKMVRDFQSVIGIEAKEQFLEMTGIMPDAVCACVGGGSNSLGMFTPFLSSPVDIYGIEPLGRGENVGDHAATMKFGTKGKLHGFESYLLQDENGEPLPVYSIASGLDYPGVGPEHAYLRDTGRVNYETVSDEEAMEAFFLLCRYEGIIPAIESAHAVAYAIRYAKEHQSGSILACLSGRGDKDIDYVYENYGCGEQFKLDYDVK
ncbi:MAG: pyridoxal-phosphate dependent enzyme, partial [Clostridia bacterium]|nr:pyridoxal-phosphate dependent enzyme [Clostridia bacterium]